MVPGYDPGQARATLAGLTKPDPKERAAQIVAWAICWPWNLAWTLCVYNPFRYVGEFLLRELQSALFEISNGQFRSIERDLTLDPLPPPYPISERHDRHKNAVAQTGSVEVMNETLPGETAVPEPTTVPTRNERATESPVPDSSTATEVAADAALEESTTKQKPDKETVAAEAPNSVEDIPAEVEAQLAKGGASDSYTWEPPEPTAYVPLSDRPLKAVKYDTGATHPRTPEKQTAPAAPTPASDPWFEKQSPNR